jgi:hypothetical protein
MRTLGVSRAISALVVCGVVGALLGGAPGTGQAPAAADHARPPTLVGIATQNFREAWPQFHEQTGRVPAISQRFWSTELDWPNKWAASELADLHKHGSIAYIELKSDDLAALADGRKDEALAALVDSIAPWLKGGDDRHILIAPLPEANLVGHSWGGDPVRYRQSYARIRAAFLDAGLGPEKVRFVFAMNGISSPGYDYRQFWPGNAAVDIIGFAKLNRGDPWRDYDSTFQMHIDEMREKISTTKPMIITQTGTIAPRGQWLTDMFTRLPEHPQIIGAIYFNRAHGQHDWRVLEDGKLEPAFRDGMQAWSPPSEHRWLFDGRLDDWVRAHGGDVSRRFGDIGGSPHVDAIEWLADEGVTGGCAPDRFCPVGTVTRAQMASLLVRALDLPKAEGTRFVDTHDSVHREAIESLAEAGITGGCNEAGDRFCPSDRVSRAQMATFLVKALELPPTDSQRFTDTHDSRHREAIESLAEAGITGGCNEAGDRFCPGEHVRRAQMATFLQRGLE